MDDGETQDSSSLFSSNAENVSSSLPKMHSLVQCGTEKYWEIESSCTNWIRFIKVSSGPVFESQTSSENEQDGDVSRLFASIASTEPQAAASGDSSGVEMIIQVEACFVTGIGHLLAVRAMENSHGALYSVEKNLPLRSQKPLSQGKLHLMRPGDKICYVQNGDKLIMEYRCETVIETCDSQNLATENFSHLNQSQEEEIDNPTTQQFAQKTQEGMYFTQEPESQRPCSQASALRESIEMSNANQKSQKLDKHLEVADDEILSQASSGDTTVDPTEVCEEKPTSPGIRSSTHTPVSLHGKENPVRDEIETIPVLLAPESSHTREPSVRDEGPKITESEKNTPASLRERKSPIGDEIDESPGIFAPQFSHTREAPVRNEPPTGTKRFKHTTQSSSNERKSSIRDEIEESPDRVAPQTSHMRETLIRHEAPNGTESVMHSTESASNEIKTPIGDEIDESPGLLAPDSSHTRETIEELASPPAPESLTKRETPINNDVEESPGLFAPTQPLELLVAKTIDRQDDPILPDDSLTGSRPKRTPRRKRSLEQLVRSSHTEEKATATNKSEVTPVRVTRSKTGDTHPRQKKARVLRILVTGYEVDSTIETLVSKIGGTLIHDLVEAKTATHVVAKDLKRTIKLMIGLCCTNKIVSLEWLRASAADEELLPCDGFLVIDRKLSNAITRNLQKGKVLDQHTVYLCESISKPPPNECRLLVEAAGGAILTDLSSLKEKSMNQLIIVRKGNSFSRGEKALCTTCVNAGATVWTVDKFLTVMETQSRT